MSELQKQQSTNGQINKPKNHTDKSRLSVLKADRLQESPENLSHDDILNAQKQVGNQVVQRALDQNKNSKLADSKGILNQEFTNQIKQKRGSGTVLPKNIQVDVGKKLGNDLEGVHIHTDATADKLSRSINARAFTLGKDIFFKNGVYAPDTNRGRETIIHELTHVVQQSRGGANGGKIKLGAPNTTHEKEADMVGKKLAPMTISSSSSGAVAQPQYESSGFVQRGPEEEEPLQMQPESFNTVQRSSPEEEEPLQMQLDTVNTVQRSSPEEDEPLQMQSESLNTLQRSSPEEEEPLQMQSDQSNTIQRTLQEELENERVRRLQSGGRKNRNEQIDKLESKNEKISLDKNTISQAKKNEQDSTKNAEKLGADLGAKSKEMGIGSKKNLKNLAKLDEKRDKKNKEMMGKQFNEEKEERHTKSRNELMNTIKNKKSSTEDVKSAQEQLDMMHKRGKMDTFKSFFTPGKTTKSYSEQAMESRKQSLKESAKSGDKDAFDKYKTEKAERTKNSTWTKFKSGAGSVAGGIASGLGGLIGGLAKSQAGNIKTHFGGKSEDKDDKEEKSGKEEKSSSGSSGVGAMMEKYGELVVENKKLKEELEKIKAK